ncbi:MAG: hypothetical protein Crog4KO_26170 [Crocinitomicaceae bacterium]
MNYFILFFSIVLGSVQLYAQEDFNFYADSIQLYAIGENHTKENAEIQIAAIDYVNAKKEVDFVFFELPRNHSNAFNQYVLNGTNEALVDGLLSVISNQPTTNIKTILNHLKAHNSDSLNNKIEVRTVDQFGYGVRKVNAKILALLYPELRESSAQRTVEYIFERKTYTLISEHEFFYRLLADLNRHETEMQELLGNKFASYKMDLKEGIKDAAIEYREANEIRENHITEQMLQYMNDSVCAITINGAAHVLKKTQDHWFEDYDFSSALSRLRYYFRINTCSIILQYPELIERTAFNLLTLQLKKFFKQTDARYTTLHRDELISKYPFAANRCDAIILCDL